MPKYRRTNNLVDAVQWTGDNLKEVINFVILHGVKPVTCFEVDVSSTGTFGLDIPSIPYIPEDSWLVIEKTNKIAVTTYTDELFQNLFEFVLNGGE